MSDDRLHVGVELHNGKTVFHADHPKENGKRPFDTFRWAVKWPHADRGWLGEFFGLPFDDPKLDLHAIGAALDGRLCVYITKQGVIGDFGRPKPKRERRRT